jgi:hypothetical protein
MRIYKWLLEYITIIIFLRSRDGLVGTGKTCTAGFNFPQGQETFSASQLPD